MSDSPVVTQPQTLRQQFAGRWQIPLLLISVTMLGLGIWRLRPAPPPVDIEDLYAHAVKLREARLYRDAGDFLEEILNEPGRDEHQRQRLHGLMAKVIFDYESQNFVHAAGNLQAIIEHSTKSRPEGGRFDAGMNLVRAQTFAWMKQPQEAVREYQEALAAGADEPWEIRRNILEIQRTSGGMAAGELHTACEEFLAAEDVSEELLFWAVEQKVELYTQEDRHEEAERFLTAHAERFSHDPWRSAYGYLQAFCWHHLGRLDEAERVLRAMRDRLIPADRMYARSGWLLGTILQRQDSPAVALSLFDDVIANTTPDPHHIACWMGRAEALAVLERFDESVAAYEETIRLTMERPYGARVDLRVVRESTSALCQAQIVARRLPEALGYMRLAAKLAPPADLEIQAVYAERLADLAMSLGREVLLQAEATPTAGDSAERNEARAYLLEAAGHYLRLAELARDGEPAARACWQAADAYDLAGDRPKAAEILERFVREHFLNSRAPMALLRLGQMHQASGQIGEAIEKYRQNLRDFPRTPSAVASLVPLADCLLLAGRAKEAEEVLLRIVVRRPDDPISLITPSAAEYRDGLYRLADLYLESGEFDRAIARYEEAIERYSDDPRNDRALYLLAEACRRSAAAIQAAMQDHRQHSDQAGHRPAQSAKGEIRRGELAGGDARHPLKADAASQGELRTAYQQRLRRAGELYGRVIEALSRQPAGELNELDELYLKLSHFWRADVAYDETRMAAQEDAPLLAEVLEMYEQAAWQYQNDPSVMAAYVQMIHCHLQLGSPAGAKRTLQRARWALRGMTEERFQQESGEERAFWEEYLAWLERTPALAG